jgi:predicted CXXCH cytochrome family protein
MKQWWLLIFLLACLVPLAVGQPCESCHRAIAESFKSTGMGRSFALPSAASVGSGSYYHAPSASHFSVVEREGRYFQRRHQLDAAGRQVNVLEKAIDYVMGSGNSARTFLHRTPQDKLIELPLGWYAEKGGFFAMNPGYDRPDHEGFRRPITYDCMFCHNAYPKIPPLNGKAFSESVYPGELPLGIDCARCHGPGERHSKSATRETIVNPGRLSRERQLDVCMSCHLESTSFPLPNALLRYDRGPFSFQPGQPLAGFILNFDHAPKTGHDEKFEIVNSAYRLRKSACFNNSTMTCTTCHNPHEAPRGEAAARHYNGVCRQCHTTAFNRQVSAGKHTGLSNCIECHMPRRRTEDVIHVAMTDHLIQRQRPPGDLLAARQETREVYRGPVVLYYPAALPRTAEGELYLAVAQVKQSSNLKAGIAQLRRAIETHKPTRAEWYIELGDALESDRQRPAALVQYREAVRRDPLSGFAWLRLGTSLRRSGRTAEALTALARAAAVEPDRAVIWHELGLAHQAAGHPVDAMTSIRRAIERDPDLAEAHTNLGILLASAGDLTRAKSSFREAIRLEPASVDPRVNFANVLMPAGRLAEAEAELQTALRRKPDDAGARYSLAMLFGRTGRYEDAERELQSCLRIDSNFADAHSLLGDLKMAKNRPADAAVHYRALLKLRPSAQAELNLGLALAANGDRTAAADHLRRAAAGGDPEVRLRASEALGQLTPLPPR